MRTPWRDALDGKARVMQSLMTERSHEHIAQYFRESKTLRNLVDPRRFENAVVQMTVEFVDSTRDGVRRAEPFWLWDSITREIHSRTRYRTAAQRPNGLFFRPYRNTELPVREGLVWFQQPIEIVPAAMRSDGDARGIWCRAVFFGEGQVMSVGRAGHLQIARDKAAALGVIAFLDGPLSWGTPGGLFPWVCNRIEEGQNLHEYGRMLKHNTPDLTDDDFILSSWPMVFCRALFGLLAERKLRFGGSVVERDARREAARNGYAPVVQIVDWRKAHYVYPEGHIPQWVDWRYRWSVRPHLRHLASGKVVQVRGHVKGPEGKPFKQPRDRVNLVRY